MAPDTRGGGNLRRNEMNKKRSVDRFLGSCRQSEWGKGEREGRTSQRKGMKGSAGQRISKTGHLARRARSTGKGGHFAAPAERKKKFTRSETNENPDSFALEGGRKVKEKTSTRGGSSWKTPNRHTLGVFQSPFLRNPERERSALGS